MKGRISNKMGEIQITKKNVNIVSGTKKSTAIPSPKQKSISPQTLFIEKTAPFHIYNMLQGSCLILFYKIIPFFEEK